MDELFFEAAHLRASLAPVREDFRAEAHAVLRSRRFANVCINGAKASSASGERAAA